tara:strand:- start:4743 stop:6626 length:1884 start_codon:yes stop_codon:yes gene_type:complete
MTNDQPSDNPNHGFGETDCKGKTRLLALAEKVEVTFAGLNERGGEMPHAELLSLWRARIRPFWRLHPGMYEVLADKFLRIGDLFSVVDCAREGMQLCGNRPLLVYRCALALARMGARGQAEELLSENETKLAALPDFRPLIARLHKDAWIATRDEGSLRKARDEYARAAAEPRGDVYYPAVNAATLSLFMGDNEGAERFGKLVRDDLAGRKEMNYWELASLGEAELSAGELDAAREAYGLAVATGPTPDQLGSTRDQASLLLEKLGFDSEELSDVLGHTRVVCIAGHIPDGKGRETPRFPADRVLVVRESLGKVFARIAPTTGIGAAAAGGDLLALDALREMGIQPTVVLPMKSDVYAGKRVAPSGGEWTDRFHEIISDGGRLLEAPATSSGNGGQTWSFGNDLILGAARQQALAARGDCEVVAVWDGKKGDGMGGTHAMVLRAKSIGARVWVIDPMDGTTREWKPAGGSATIGAPTSQWGVHVEGRTRRILWSCLESGIVDKAAALATNRIELGAQSRLVFNSMESCGKFLEALDRSECVDDCGVGISVGPAAGEEGHAKEPEFYQDAAILANAALLHTRSFLSTWECASLAALYDEVDVAFEFAGRMEFQGNRIAPFYTVMMPGF